MPKPSDDQHQALAQLLGFGSHSARKSHYPELVARLEELEGERNRYKWLFEHAVHGIFQASIHEGIRAANRSEEHTSELQSLMRISYAVFCLKKKTHHNNYNTPHNDLLYKHTIQYSKQNLT